MLNMITKIRNVIHTIRTNVILITANTTTTKGNTTATEGTTITWNHIGIAVPISILKKSTTRVIMTAIIGDIMRSITTMSITKIMSIVIFSS